MDTNQNCENCDKGACGVHRFKCEHRNMIPVLIILFAITFSLGYQGYLSAEAVNTLWPIIVGLAGVVKLMGHKCVHC